MKTIRQWISWRDGKQTSKVRFYLSGLKPGVRRFAQAVRTHSSIENALHGVLDMTFAEDQNRARDRRLAEILARLRRLAVGLLRRHPSQHSIQGERQITGGTITCSPKSSRSQRV